MNNNTIDTNLLRQVAFIAIIIFLGIVLFRELWFFLSAFLGAVTFYIIMRERMFYLTEKKEMVKCKGSLDPDAAFVLCYIDAHWHSG